MLRVQPDFVGQEHEGLVCAFDFGGCGGFLVCFVVCGCGLVLFFLKGASGSQEVAAEKNANW